MKTQNIIGKVSKRYGRMKTMPPKDSGWVKHNKYTDYYGNEKGQIYSTHGSGRIMSPVKNIEGYLKVGIRHLGLVRTILVHRFIADCFIPEDKSRKQINHINGIKDDNRVSNLERCTPSENTMHSVRLGNHPSNRGTSNGMAKLDAISVEAMRHIRSLGVIPVWQIAGLFGVSANHVRRITGGEAWKHLKTMD
jgi:hypothetical protein